MRTAKMTRAHFELIARVLREARVNEPGAVEVIAAEFARELRATNPGFKPERFLEATR